MSDWRGVLDDKYAAPDLTTRLRAAHMEYVDGVPCGYGEPINPDGPLAADVIEQLRFALDNLNRIRRGEGGTKEIDPETGLPL